MIAATLVLISFFGADPARVTNASASTQLDEIRAAWTRRSEAVATGVVEWAYVSQPFGRFESYWLADAAGHEIQQKGKLSFAGNAVRYESESTEYPELATASYRSQTEHGYFRAHLLSHFQDEHCVRRIALTYSIVATPDEVVHSWEAPANTAGQYPRAIVAPAGSLSSIMPLAEASGFAGDSSSNLSGVPSPVLHQLCCLPVLLALRPGLFDARLIDHIEMEHEPSVRNLRSELVEVSLPPRNDATDSLEWRMWLDPAKDFSVCRIFAMNAGDVLVQCDIGQEQINNHWIPAEWTVQILDKDPSFARQIVKANRSNLKLGSEPAGDINITPSLATGIWINDLITGQHRIVTEQGDWEFPASLAPWQSYEQLLARSRGEKVDPALSTIPGSLLRRSLSAIARWPGIAIPLSLLGAGMFLAIRLFAPRTIASEGPDGRNDLEAKP